MALLRSLHQRYLVRRDPVAWARRQGVRIGEDCRLLAIHPGTFGSEPYLVSLGHHVTVTSGVQFITHDGGVWVLRKDYPSIDVFGRTHVGDNVFLGLRSIILPGVTIGDNVVVGAGSVVNKNIPSNSVAAGVPARVVSTLDDYQRRSLDRGVMTKGMSTKEKKSLLEGSIMPFRPV